MSLFVVAVVCDDVVFGCASATLKKKLSNLRAQVFLFLPLLCYVPALAIVHSVAPNNTNVIPKILFGVGSASPR
eukprot:m.150139 g.150139  ORF g.150139 m.150139 type:complete len:74 (+) comp24457_c0_seq4:2103-2324(+)